METRPAMTQADIEKGLRSIGIERGDVVLLHSSLSSLGHVTGGAQTVVDAFLNVLGSEGTLAVPTFGDLGIVTEAVRSHPKAVNSIHPLASVAGWCGATPGGTPLAPCRVRFAGLGETPGRPDRPAA